MRGLVHKSGEEVTFEKLTSSAQWQTYQSAIRQAQARGLIFALGGAFAVGVYTGHWRDTRDLDIYVLPEDREKMIAALSEIGFADLHPVEPYDRNWIYRACRDDIIVDTIWAMANQRAHVDELWLTRGPEVRLNGEPVRTVGAEEMLWDKVYILQRDRCDWPDVLNLVYATG